MSPIRATPRSGNIHQRSTYPRRVRIGQALLALLHPNERGLRPPQRTPSVPCDDLSRPHYSPPPWSRPAAERLRSYRSRRGTPTGGNTDRMVPYRAPQRSTTTSISPFTTRTARSAYRIIPNAVVCSVFLDIFLSAYCSLVTRPEYIACLVAAV